jgi:hypothetical protein
MEYLRAHRLIVVRGLRTPYGESSYSVECIPQFSSEPQVTGRVLHIKIEDGIRVPPGGIVVAVPEAFEGCQVTINNRPANPKPGDRIIVRQVPAELWIGPGGWERAPTR